MLLFLFLISMNRIPFSIHLEPDSTLPSPDYIIPITLNDADTTFIGDINFLGIGYAYLICTETKPLTGTFLTTQTRKILSDFWLFDGEDFKQIIDRLDKINSTVSSTLGCLGIYRATGKYAGNAMAFVTIKDLKPENCHGPIFFLDPLNDDPFSISVASVPNKNCEIFIISQYIDHQQNIRKIWFSEILSENATLEFRSVINDKFLVNITTPELPQWKTFGIYTTALSILISPRSNLTIKLASDYFNENHEINVGEDDLKGIMVSPSYADQNQVLNISQELYIIKSDQPTTVSLNIKDLKGDGVLYFTSYPDINKLQYLKQGQILNITVTSLRLFFIQYNYNIDYFLIEYETKGVPGILTTTDFTEDYEITSPYSTKMIHETSTLQETSTPSSTNNANLNVLVLLIFFFAKLFQISNF